MKTSRRIFFKQSGLVTAGTMLIPSFLDLGRFQLGASRPKKIVVVQLSGGNDGLNTVVPYRNDLYYKYRPSVGIQKDDLIHITDETGLNPNLTGLSDLLDQGYVSIINQVGYPNPDRSHFRSMDIWQSATSSDEYESTGWIGRYLDSQCETCHISHKALEIDDTLSLALKGTKTTGLAVKNPNTFRQNLRDYEHDIQSNNESLNFLHKVHVDTRASARYVYEKYHIKRSSKTYPETFFGKNLKVIAQMIMSGADTSIFYTSLSGFDTHNNQLVRQNRLLQEYGNGMKTFISDLKENGLLDETLVLTFSEFGRRVKENASQGTDHGTANSVFLMGGKLKTPGLYNAMPDLTDLDEFDLRHTVDFRRIYATILEGWLGSNSESILNGQFKPLQII